MSSSRTERPALQSLLTLTVLAGAVLLLHAWVDRADQASFLVWIPITAGAWWWCVRAVSLPVAIGIGLALRLSLLWWLPSLSNDYFRFLWDGELWLAGYHPMDAVPAAAPAAFSAAHATLLDNMNSAGYFTVYPPLSQLYFGLAAWLGDGITSQVVWLRTLLILCELAVLWLLVRLDRTPSRMGVIAYALLPLPILEIAGNAHFEGFALLGLLLAVYGFRQNRPFLSGAGLAVGVAAKLVPALAGPVLLFACWKRGAAEANRAGGLRSAGQFLGSAVLVSLVLFGAFFAAADLTGFGESLDLYFRTFEFNGSLYLLVRAVGFELVGYNWIAYGGPGLAAASLVSILGLAVAFALDKLSLENALLWSFAVYIACATTVHPWYAIYVAGLAPLTRYRWPYLLAFTVFLSYLAYGESPIEVPLWATVLEYGSVLALVVWERLSMNDSQAALA